VITAPFDYESPDSLEEAIRMLHENGEDAKLLAGGHSLVPLMKLRLAAPSVLIDLRRIPGLHGIQRVGERPADASSDSPNGAWRIGPMTRHADLQDAEELGVVARAAGQIADQQVRNRGTIGGSLAHGDPASDLPAVLLATEGEVSARGPGGERTIAAADLFEDYLTTALAQDEAITSVRIPVLEGYGHGYRKFTRRAEDWAMVGVCALVKKGADGNCEDVRVGLTHMSSTPVRASATEAALRGGPLDADAIAAAAEQAAEGTDPPGDLNATPEYKRHLARVLTRRALEEAAGL
jgi:carbon-monoxide dehydrogenase medium subunit